MKKHVIFTAADAKYFKLMKNMVDSYHKNAYRDDVVLRVFDLGLTDEQKAELKDKVDCFIKADWDIDLPAFKNAPEYKKAFSVTPFLPKYCADLDDVDVIIWVDGDAWIQTPEGVNDYIEAAQSNKLVICPEAHHLYPRGIHAARAKLWNIPFLKGKLRKVTTWTRKSFATRYGDKATGNKCIFENVYNAGVFAAKKDSPAWDGWAKTYQKAHMPKLSYVSDQIPVNYAIQTGKVEIHTIPALYNWICQFRRPVWHPEKQLFVEPLYPHNPIHVLHLLGKSKDNLGGIKDIYGNDVDVTLFGNNE